MVDKKRMTPIHDACKFGCVNVVRYLIQAGANLSLKNQDGFTPLDMCRGPSQRSIEMFQLLEKEMYERYFACKIFVLCRLFQQRHCGIEVGERVLSAVSCRKHSISTHFNDIQVMTMVLKWSVEKPGREPYSFENGYHMMKIIKNTVNQMKIKTES